MDSPVLWSRIFPPTQGINLGPVFSRHKLKEKSSCIKSRLHVGAHELSPICGFPKDDAFTSPLGGLCGCSLTWELFLKLLSKCQLFQGVMWLLRSPSWRVWVLLQIFCNFQKLRLVEKERCQGQCDLGLLAWALMGFPALGCHCRNACLWDLASIQVVHLPALPHTGWGSVQPFCSDCCSLWRIKLSRQSFKSSLSLSWCQP